MRPCIYIFARSEVLTAVLKNIQIVWFVKAELVYLLYCTVLYCRYLIGVCFVVHSMQKDMAIYIYIYIYIYI